jgi:hypothetical protein
MVRENNRQKSLENSRKILLIDEHILKDTHILKLNILGCDKGSGNLYDSSTSNLGTIINAGQDARNVIIARQQEREEVEVYNPTHYQLPLDYLETTWKCKPEAGEQSTCRKKTISSKERFEEALHGRCPVAPEEQAFRV